MASVTDFLPEKAQAQTEIVELPAAVVLVWAAVAAAVAGSAATALALEIEVDPERPMWIDAVEHAMLLGAFFESGLYWPSPALEGF